MQPRENLAGTIHHEDAFRRRWSQPADVFSILLLLGGDIVNKALAQLAGGILTPLDGPGRGLNIGDLAAAALLWVALLVTAPGVRANTPYLLAVGGVGILQNVVVVGWRRGPGALGVHVEFRGVVGEMTAMDAQLDLEAKYPRAGGSSLPVFFPGMLLPREAAKWDAFEAAQLQAALAQKHQ
ncbi:hypothetical protein GGTG_11689 [Gaeumannomyces tritici R3-111a-1]|uniref:Uncharacterized protein n=1 Tax=Gaeumannomyces tritici (strain R3-111a-1) TaxID=644352 RepID=J3PDW6_GAET3|nr:hypothetical protein GGTG_11689 [Gaeumannomyces tritici R3-111a-1]EJT70666.1 hypothetical protein GGTG_11689 [Gaeumannomyces tritici R3-111a-1]